MEYVRPVDFAAFANSQKRISQALLDAASGAEACLVNCVHVPPGEGSPAGRHKHTFEQLYYVLSGTMNLEVEGKQLLAGPGCLVVLPAGVPHRNWNGGTEAIVHLTFQVPGPKPGEPLAIPVE